MPVNSYMLGNSKFTVYAYVRRTDLPSIPYFYFPIRCTVETRRYGRNLYNILEGEVENTCGSWSRGSGHQHILNSSFQLFHTAKKQNMAFWIAAGITGIVSFGIYKLGLFDRPEFVLQERLVEKNELLAVVATIREKNIGQNVRRLMGGTTKGIEALPQARVILKSGAKLYGAPEESEKIGIGLWFDDPKAVDAPRWAMGWAISGITPEAIREVLPTVQENSGLAEEIRVVRLGQGPILRGSIPWRSFLTPMIGAMIQWHRAYQFYEKGGYKASCGRGDEAGGNGTVAMEVYVPGKGETCMMRIDYVVLFGVTEDIYNDAFPVKVEKGEAASPN